MGSRSDAVNARTARSFVSRFVSRDGSNTVVAAKALSAHSARAGSAPAPRPATGRVPDTTPAHMACAPGMAPIAAVAERFAGHTRYRPGHGFLDHAAGRPHRRPSRRRESRPDDPLRPAARAERT